MKKISTAVVALALGLSELTIKEMYGGATEIEFPEAYRLKKNKKLKRLDSEAKKLNEQLDCFEKLMES